MVFVSFVVTRLYINNSTAVTGEGSVKETEIWSASEMVGGDGDAVGVVVGWLKARVSAMMSGMWLVWLRC